jgi:hypothetical protein
VAGRFDTESRLDGVVGMAVDAHGEPSAASRWDESGGPSGAVPSRSRSFCAAMSSSRWGNSTSPSDWGPGPVSSPERRSTTSFARFAGAHVSSTTPRSESFTPRAPPMGRRLPRSRRATASRWADFCVGTTDRSSRCT